MSKILTEYELILDLIQFKNYDLFDIRKYRDKAINWEKVGGQLLSHRLGSLFYYSIMSLNIEKELRVPEELMAAFGQIYEFQCLRLEARNKTLLELSSYLNDNRIKHAFLKGSVLSSTLYPAGTRASNDIDILIHPQDISVCEKSLKDMGFIQGEYDYVNNRVIRFSRKEIIFRRMNWGEIASFVKRVGLPGLEYVFIDINFSLD